MARLWRTEDGAPDGDPLRHGSPVVAIAFSPDSRLVATAGNDRVSGSGTSPPAAPLVPPYLSNRMRA